MTCTSIWFNEKNRCRHFMCFVRNPSCFPNKNPLISVLDSYPKFAQTLAAPVNCGSLAVIFLGILFMGLAWFPRPHVSRSLLHAFHGFFSPNHPKSHQKRHPLQFNSQFTPEVFMVGKEDDPGLPIGLKGGNFSGAMLDQLREFSCHVCSGWPEPTLIFCMFVSLVLGTEKIWFMLHVWYMYPTFDRVFQGYLNNYNWKSLDTDPYYTYPWYTYPLYISSPPKHNGYHIKKHHLLT